MKKPVIITIIVAVILVGAAITYVLLSPEAKMPAANQAEPSPSPSPSVSPQPTTDSNTDSPQAVKGSYTDYSSDKVASTSGTKVLFFHAPWCPQCRALENDIKSNTIPDGVTIFKVDYDSNQALRQKYGVTLQTTLVTVDNEGQLIKKYVAYDEPTFASVRDNLLE